MRTKVVFIFLASMVLVGGIFAAATYVRWKRTRSDPSAIAARLLEPRTPEPGWRGRKPLGKPATEGEVAQAADRMSLEFAYRSYRNALATGNLSLQESLWKVLQKDKPASARLADEDARRATNEGDRKLALQISDSLRR